MTFQPKLSLSDITFSSGQTLQLSEQHKVLIVGPNNSGKSQSIRDIMTILTEKKCDPVVVKDINIKRNFDGNQLEKYLIDNATLINHSYHLGSVKVQTLHTNPSLNTKALRSATGIFFKSINAKERLNICEQQGSIDLKDAKTVPQHILYDDESLMNHVSDIFRKAFNKDLAFDYRAGRSIPIYLIEKDELSGIPNKASNEYTERLRKFPLLDQQGDGVKSYAGILFETIAYRYQVTMIDEPEAFLHPPQMRRLAQTLAEEVSGQLIIATHSSDILRGFLEGTKGDLTVLRLTRDGNVNCIHELNQSAIRELWSKPNLRYSNALDAIFHEQVIICEDSSDCRLFNYVADYLVNSQGKVYPDTCYVPTGGKHAISGIAEALRASGVPVKAIFDFDLISERNILNKTLDAFGCSTEKKEILLDKWKRINLEVVGQKESISADDFKAKILDFIKDLPAKDISKGKIDELFKQKKPWSRVKSHGVDGLPKGSIRQVFKEFNEGLMQLGIFLIPVGEIENFSAETGLHGPSFVEKFLSERNVADTELDGLRNFVDEVYSAKLPSLTSSNENQGCGGRNGE